VKTAEILIMLCGAAGLLLYNIPLMLAALFAMGVHSSFFGPIKYAILPQHLRPDEVLGGTGLVEAGTYGAILLGTIAGGSCRPTSPRAECWQLRLSAA
jgi:MFS family permease